MSAATHRPAVLGVYGYSDSGKTSLLVRLIEDLSERGYRAAVVKVTDKATSTEAPGKDTTRFRDAGAALTVLSSASETGFVVPEAMSETRIIEAAGQLCEVDIVLVEGSRDESVVKVRLGDKSLRENTVFTYDGNFDMLVRQVTDFIRRGELK